MNRKVSIILYGISFIIAILGEAFLLNVTRPHMFSIIGIGVVVILTGYLFFDSIWEYISSEIRKKGLIEEESSRHNSEKWDERYTELLNIQKATYTALKKSDSKLEVEIKELSDKLDQLILLQKKSMDGQKKALNLSINYSKEHTKELLNAIKEESKGSEPSGNMKKAEQEIKPLYDDPNAALSADEIAKLFESYGK